MRNRYIAFAALLFCLSPTFAAPAVAQQDEPISDLRRSYIDDDDHRRLADLQFSVDPKTGRSLKISVSAVGPDVEPIGGFRGIHGSNRYTAEELDLVLRGLHESSVITETEQGDLIEGKIFAGDFGRLLERRVTSDGEIDFRYQAIPLPLSIHVTTNADSEQFLRTTVIIDGQSRLRCRYRIRNGSIVDLETESLGHDGYIAQRGPDAIRRNRWLTATTDDVSAPVEEREWNKRDLEGQWVLMMSTLDKSPNRITDWVAWLAQEKQFELLELLAIYQPDAFKSHGVGKALLKADAPQWIRVAAWHRNTAPYLGHGRQQATQMLLEASPGVVEHWLKIHQEKIDNWEPGLGPLYGRLQNDEIAAKDSSKYLNPLKPYEVFDALTSTTKAEQFGDRLRAEEGVAYEHQILRAINAVAISGRRSDQLKLQLQQLVDHPNERVRIEALLAHSFLLPDTEAEKPTRLIEIVEDKSEADKVRQAAMLAVSYQQHPALILKLHTVARTPEHPAWNSAVSRIGDIGNDYSRQILDTLPKDQLTSDQRSILEDSLQRLSDRRRTRKTFAYDLAKLIRLSSFATLQEHGDADLIRKWVKAEAKQMVPNNLAILKQNYSAMQLQNAAPTWTPEFAKNWQAQYSILFDELTAKIVLPKPKK